MSGPWVRGAILAALPLPVHARDFIGRKDGLPIRVSLIRAWLDGHAAMMTPCDKEPGLFSKTIGPPLASTACVARRVGPASRGKLEHAGARSGRLELPR